MLKMKFLKDDVKISICSKNSIVMNNTSPTNSVINNIFKTFEIKYLFNLFKIISPEVF
jgi:adenosine deaminase